MLALLLLAAACEGGTAGATHDVVLASTTSLEDSGLLEALLPGFRAAHPGVRVRLVGVGSGQALGLGRRGDADVLLVHAEDDELRFMSEGAGRHRQPVMRNDFVIVGPPADPANVAAAGDAVSALRAVSDAGARFVSRGDSSGTHRAELRLWRAAGAPGRSRVQLAETGQGMAETLVIASERGAYALADRATFITLADRLALRILHAGDAELINVYSVITVANARNPAGADLLARWLTSEAAARIIAGFPAPGTAPLFEPLNIPPAPAADGDHGPVR